MTAEYRYLVEDLITGEIGELPLSNVTYEDYLNRPGKLSASLPLTVADENEELLDVGRRAFYVMRNQSIEWGGLLLKADVPLGSSDVKLECLGWLGWLDMRDIWTDEIFSQVDQFTIVQTLVDDAQDPAANIGYDATGTPTGVLAGTGADMGITVTWTSLSGVLRDRLQEYRYFNGKNLGAAVRELAALEDGFDYRMGYAINVDGGKIDKTILLSHPTQGTDQSVGANGEPVPGFEYVRGQGGNILQRGVTFDASNMAWRMRGWGSGNDVSRVSSTQINEDRRGVYPFFDGQANAQSSVIEQGTLDDNTAAELATRDHVVVLPAIEVDPDLDPKWHTYGIGDTYNVDIVDGFCSTSGPHRIIGYKMDADNDLPTLFLAAT